MHLKTRIAKPSCKLREAQEGEGEDLLAGCSKFVSEPGTRFSLCEVPRSTLNVGALVSLAGMWGLVGHLILEGGPVISLARGLGVGKRSQAHMATCAFHIASWGSFPGGVVN